MMMGFVLHTQIVVLQLKKPITQAGEQQCVQKIYKKRTLLLRAFLGANFPYISQYICYELRRRVVIVFSYIVYAEVKINPNCFLF